VAYGIAEADAARDFLLKIGLKSDFGSVEPEQSVAKSNRAYAISNDTPHRILRKAPLKKAPNHKGTQKKAPPGDLVPL
jgi:hypothetical protein